MQDVSVTYQLQDDGGGLELPRSRAVVFGSHRHGDTGSVTVDVTDDGCVALRSDDGRLVFLDDDDVAAVIGYLQQALRATTADSDGEGGGLR